MAHRTPDLSCRPSRGSLAFIRAIRGKTHETRLAVGLAVPGPTERARSTFKPDRGPRGGRYASRSSARQSVGGCPDHRLNARVKALASE
ncbi:hypothetical protein C7450_103434 [Chelatococcus asaccharovorans]|uniref:Uncharacterized protein n=1 Tax=Chelatococcus asaccharovorans TaxID=28210 RepID=A0A2V3UD63_9HYPH|nr:hypothetical protein C7450_103434 [Chelatococcus asaccharovorans]